MSSYKTISQIGSSAVPTSDTSPLTYCVSDGLDSEFLHGGSTAHITGKYGRNCQGYMAQHCAANWDEICEHLSRDRHVTPNMLGTECANGEGGQITQLTAGDVLILNTATRKYRVGSNSQCNMVYEPFDPLVASSPMVAFYRPGCNGSCIPVYAVNPIGLDRDPVMNKLLSRPGVALNILVNIYNHALRANTLKYLKGTRLYALFMGKPFQTYINALSDITHGRGKHARANPVSGGSQHPNGFKHHPEHHPVYGTHPAYLGISTQGALGGGGYGQADCRGDMGHGGHGRAPGMQNTGCVGYRAQGCSDGKSNCGYKTGY